jgi:hypothetical protein
MLRSGLKEGLALGNRTYFSLRFSKIQLVAWKIIEFPPQLSYSVNESQSEVAVREGDSLSKRTKAQSD